VVRDIEEYTAILHLLHAQIQGARLELFTTKASRVFYEQGNQHCVFNRLEVLSLIRKMFARELEDIPELGFFGETLYIPDMSTMSKIGDDAVSVGPSSYKYTDSRNQHYWEASVIVGTQFEGKLKYLSGVPHEYLREVAFTVLWIAFVSESGEYSHETISDVCFSSATLEVATEENLKRYGFRTGLERLKEAIYRAESKG
jgi:hypothetical protein